jgi:hypothetical protein
MPDDPVEKVREFNALFGVLRALNQEERLVALLIADLRADANRINHWPQPGVATNPVYSYFFKEVYLAPFEPAETRAMLDGIGQLMGVAFDEPLVAAIHAESGGHPILSRQIASALIKSRLMQDVAEDKARKALLALRQYGLVAGDVAADGEELRILPNLFARWLRMTMTAEERRRWTL